MDDAGKTMREVVVSVQRVADVVSEITAASLEQSQGIGEINRAISQMDTVTQHNAALVEEAAPAAKLLQYQTNSLSNFVSAFKVTPALLELTTSISRDTLLLTNNENRRNAYNCGAEFRSFPGDRNEREADIVLGENRKIDVKR